MGLTCKSCIFQKDSICHKIKQPIDLENSRICNWFSAAADSCQICGSLIPADSAVVVTNGLNNKDVICCQNCSKYFSTCQVCPTFNQCEFETNPDPMPKIVQQQIKQGNAVMTTQVQNPERIEKFCKPCKCWNEECELCQKQLNQSCNKM